MLLRPFQQLLRARISYFFVGGGVRIAPCDAELRFAD